MAGSRLRTRTGTGFDARGYLSLEVEGQHGKAEVQHEILGLEALQSPAHSEGHQALALDQDHGTADVKGPHQKDQDEASLAEEGNEGSGKGSPG